MTDELKNALSIRYLKLYITLRISGRCILPRNKVSAIRGGIGEMLLRKNCIGGRDCGRCGFAGECVVQHIMYSKFAFQPAFASNGDSVGYVLECHDTRESFQAGDKIKIGLLLFGSTIVHVLQVLEAVRMLGQTGLGKGRAKYVLTEAADMHGTVVGTEEYTDLSLAGPSYVYEYVNSRRESFREASGLMIIMKSPLTVKYHRQFLEEFDTDAFFRAVKRRIYMLDCLEGIDALEYYRKRNAHIYLRSQVCYMSGIPRYSSRKNEKMVLRGLMGRMQIEAPDQEMLMLLLAGELLHIGKNTSFGFGEYELKQEEETNAGTKYGTKKCIRGNV